MVEAMITLAVLSLLAASAFTVLERANRYAMTARLYTLAETLARDEIERLHVVGPFNPQNPSWAGGPQIPPELALGGPNTRQVPLYTDPQTDQVLTTAEIQTTIRDVGSMNTRAGQVRVAFQFAGRMHEVRMNTLRTSDSP
jgi:hypothetical protein